MNARGRGHTVVGMPGEGHHNSEQQHGRDDTRVLSVLLTCAQSVSVHAEAGGNRARLRFVMHYTDCG